MSDTSTPFGASLRERGEAKIRDAQEGVSNAVSSAAQSIKSTAAEQLDQLETAVRRNPFAAAGIAAGIGFFLAVLARR